MQTLNEKKKLGVGRPRVLTEKQILDAALDIGLEHLTLKKLATALNAGTTTLYQYFDSREALVEAAALHALNGLPLPEDKGQNWVEFSYEYIMSLKDLMAFTPSNITHYFNFEYGFELHFSLIERFLESLSKRGFEAREATQLFNRLSMAAVSGAIEDVRHQKIEDRNLSMLAAYTEIMNGLNKSDFPNLVEGMDVLTQSAESKSKDLLYLIYKDTLEKRGEDLSMLGFLNS
ncbi:MAG: TetR/AcrR family transcriptional regulator [Parvibaculales bacterium]